MSHGALGYLDAPARDGVVGSRVKQALGDMRIELHRGKHEEVAAGWAPPAFRAIWSHDRSLPTLLDSVLKSASAAAAECRG